MKIFLSIIILVGFIELLFLSIWYLSFRMSALFEIKSRRSLFFIISISIVSSLVAMLSGTRLTNNIIGILNILGGYVFSFFMFLTFILLLLHLLQLIMKLPQKWVCRSALLLSFFITIAGAIQANHFVVNEIEIQLNGLKQDVLIMHISDIHIGHHRGRDYLARIVAETNCLKPDMVLINGDMLDSNVALIPGVLSPLSDFEAPVYYVGGNHEEYMETERALKMIEQQGVRILHNEVVNTHGIYLIGLDYMKPDNETFDIHASKDERVIKDEILKLSIGKDQPSVLMHHSPLGVKYISKKGIDLMLSGHTHAGQMFPNTLFAAIFFTYLKGLYEAGNTKVFVSSGAGTFGARIRLNTSNELDLIRLKPEADR